MPNYQETTVAGSSYIRATNVHISNGVDEKFIAFVEEQVISLADGETIRKPAGEVFSEFTAENAGAKFDILNPVTGLPVNEYDPDTGAEITMTSTYQEVYTLLYSLYLHLAQQRDADAAASAAAKAKAEAEAQAQAEADASAQAEVDAAEAAAAEEPVVEEPVAEDPVAE